MRYTGSVAIIDPVGIKAGMDHYDLLLGKGLQAAGTDVILYSNFTDHHSSIPLEQVFYNTGVAKWKAIASNFFGHLKAFRACKKKKTAWIIVHVFRAGIFDLVVFTIARMMGLKLCAIVHDIESLDTFTIPFVRNLVLHRLPAQRVVHNDFCRTELTRQPGDKGKPIAVIPHVHFRHLFQPYHEHPELLSALRQDTALARSIDSRLEEALKNNRPVLLFFGQIKRAKGLEVLLKALPAFEENPIVIVAGRTRDDHWDRYEAIISANGLTEKVIPVIRHISDKERDFLFSVSRAIVLPYTHIYQSGVLLMAMSFPLAVIASDLLPNKYLVKHGENGLLFESGNPADLARQFNKMLADKDCKLKLESKAMHDIDALYNPETIGRQFRSVLFPESSASTR